MGDGGRVLGLGIWSPAVMLGRSAGPRVEDSAAGPQGRRDGVPGWAVRRSRACAPLKVSRGKFRK